MASDAFPREFLADHLVQSKPAEALSRLAMLALTGAYSSDEWSAYAERRRRALILARFASEVETDPVLSWMAEHTPNGYVPPANIEDELFVEPEPSESIPAPSFFDAVSSERPSLAAFILSSASWSRDSVELPHGVSIDASPVAVELISAPVEFQTSVLSRLLDDGVLTTSVCSEIWRAALLSHPPGKQEPPAAALWLFENAREIFDASSSQALSELDTAFHRAYGSSFVSDLVVELPSSDVPAEPSLALSEIYGSPVHQWQRLGSRHGSIGTSAAAAELCALLSVRARLAETVSTHLDDPSRAKNLSGHVAVAFNLSRAAKRNASQIRRMLSEDPSGSAAGQALAALAAGWSSTEPSRRKFIVQAADALLLHIVQLERSEDVFEGVLRFGNERFSLAAKLALSFLLESSASEPFDSSLPPVDAHFRSVVYAACLPFCSQESRPLVLKSFDELVERNRASSSPLRVFDKTSLEQFSETVLREWADNIVPLASDDALLSSLPDSFFFGGLSPVSIISELSSRGLSSSLSQFRDEQGRGLLHLIVLSERNLVDEYGSEAFSDALRLAVRAGCSPEHTDNAGLSSVDIARSAGLLTSLSVLSPETPVDFDSESEPAIFSSPEHSDMAYTPGREQIGNLVGFIHANPVFSEWDSSGVSSLRHVISSLSELYPDDVEVSEALSEAENMLDVDFRRMAVHSLLSDLTSDLLRRTSEPPKKLLHVVESLRIAGPACLETDDFETAVQTVAVIQRRFSRSLASMERLLSDGKGPEFSLYASKLRRCMAKLGYTGTHFDELEILADQLSEVDQSLSSMSHLDPSATKTSKSRREQIVELLRPMIFSSVLLTGEMLFDESVFSKIRAAASVRDFDLISVLSDELLDAERELSELDSALADTGFSDSSSSGMSRMIRLVHSSARRLSSPERLQSSLQRMGRIMSDASIVNQMTYQHSHQIDFASHGMRPVGNENLEPGESLSIADSSGLTGILDPLLKRGWGFSDGVWNKGITRVILASKVVDGQEILYMGIRGTEWVNGSNKSNIFGKLASPLNILFGDYAAIFSHGFRCSGILREMEKLAVARGAKLVLAGHSLGGSAVETLMAGSRVASLGFIVGSPGTGSTFFSRAFPDSVKRLFRQFLSKPLADFFGEESLFGYFDRSISPVKDSRILSYRNKKDPVARQSLYEKTAAFEAVGELSSDPTRAGQRQAAGAPKQGFLSSFCKLIRQKAAAISENLTNHKLSLYSLIMAHTVEQASKNIDAQNRRSSVDKTHRAFLTALAPDFVDAIGTLFEKTPYASDALRLSKDLAREPANGLEIQHLLDKAEIRQIPDIVSRTIRLASQTNSLGFDDAAIPSANPSRPKFAH